MMCTLFSVLVVIGVMLLKPAALMPFAEASKKPDYCDEYNCGDVMIKYPFGSVGTNCSKDEFFDVNCINNTSKNLNPQQNNKKPKPILTKFNLEILNLDFLDGNWLGEISVNTTSFRACAHDHDNSSKSSSNTGVHKWSSHNLSGSPFFYTDENVFVSVGCEGLASLYNETGGVIGGCTSTCSATATGTTTRTGTGTGTGTGIATGEVINGCNGYYCCHSHLYSSSWEGTAYSVEVRVASSSSSSGSGSSSGNNTCRSAFLTTMSFLQTNNATTILSSPTLESQLVPLVLRWNIGSNDHNYGYVPAIHFYMPIIGISVLATILLSCCCFCSCWRYKTKRRRQEERLRAKYFKGRLDEQISYNKETVKKTKLFTIKELKKATDNFNGDRVLGQGGQGTVYRGTLTNGQVVAVKRSKTFEESQWKQFINEVTLLSQIDHRNVVKLLGCCLEGKLPILVYELIANGTLSEHIHKSSIEFSLTWEMRMRIVSEAAGAIAYLHSSSTTPIYHRDIKSTNILLDDKYQAKVSDFGISKAVSIDQTHLTTCVRGTFGYLDPEYFRSSHFSEKSDVYSFGVLLVEIITGQQPIRVTTTEEERSLVVYFISSMTNESTLDSILDPIVLEGGTKEEVLGVANLAKRCLHSRGTQRPTMKEVAMELEGLRKKSSKAFEMREVSLEIKNVVMRSTDIGNAFTSPATFGIANLDADCDVQHSFYHTS